MSQHDVFGNPIQQPSTGRTPKKRAISVPLTPADCQTYGHSFSRLALNGVKICTVCRVHGYCPLCTPIAPPHARPFLCTEHSRESARKETAL